MSKTIFEIYKEDNKKLQQVNAELLEACKKAYNYFNKYSGENIFADGIMAMKNCQQAIAKAEVI